MEYITITKSECPSKECIVCGATFVNDNPEADCCSPYCRAMKRATQMESLRKDKADKLKSDLDSMRKPPKFNLSENPKARAEWFMSLPDEYKQKFRKFLFPQELEWAKAIAQKNLADDRYLSGFYVKNGKIIEPKSSNSEEVDEGERDQASNPEDNDFFED